MVAQTESVCLQCGRPGFDPWVGKFPREGNGNPFQYSCLENPIDGGAWCPWGRRESDTTERLHFPFTWLIPRGVTFTWLIPRGVTFAWLIPRGVTLGKSSCLSEPALGGCLEGVVRQHCSTYGLTKMLMTYWYEKAGYQTMYTVDPHYCETQKNS